MGQGKIPVEQRSFSLIPDSKFLKHVRHLITNSTPHKKPVIHTLSVQPDPYK